MLGRYGKKVAGETRKVQASLVQLEPLSRAERREVINGRPRTRAECEGGERPCPWAACRYHLGIDVGVDGGIIYNVPDLTEARETCALDVADKGGVTLEEIGDLLGVTRERIRQIEDQTLRKLGLDPKIVDPKERA